MVLPLLPSSPSRGPAEAQTTYTDNFNVPLNYLTNGVAGTMWDGLYLGAGEFAGATSVGAGAGSVSVADASISSNNVLTIASLQTDWENTADDGVLFFKVVTGDFDMSVHVIGPIDTGTFNLPGLMVRGFGAGGAPSPNAAENSLVWGRFDEFSIANMSKNNVNGVKTDTGLGTYPNTNYWLRIQRVGNVFNLYERVTLGVAWNLVGSVMRADFSGVPLQVGIEQADFGGGATRTARYEKFSFDSVESNCERGAGGCDGIEHRQRFQQRREFILEPGRGQHRQRRGHVDEQSSAEAGAGQRIQLQWRRSLWIGRHVAGGKLLRRLCRKRKQRGRHQPRGGDELQRGGV